MHNPSAAINQNFNHPSMADSPGHRPKMDPELCPTGLSVFHEDLLVNILGRLPALSFASAACVSKTWYRVCGRILSRPKLASHLSVSHDTQSALREVVENVLSEPIRPHFAIANVDSNFGLKETLQFLTSKLGSKTPIIVTYNRGIIGRDAQYGIKEVKWEDYVEATNDESMSLIERGIVLTVGFVPGLKVDAIPLVRLRKASSRVGVFVEDIRDYSASASGKPIPVGVMIFGDSDAVSDLQFVVENLDYAMPKETAIVGDLRCQFVYKSADDSRNVGDRAIVVIEAIALTFARDRDHIPGPGTIKFHVALSEGVSALGPIYRAASVRVNSGTWITARSEGQQEILDGQRILNEINEELENGIGSTELYVRVRKRRKYAIGSQKERMMTSLSFHAVVGGDEECLYLHGYGIETGDPFQFFMSDAASALSSCDRASSSLNSLNMTKGNGGGGRAAAGEVFGGFIFACCGRGQSFFDRDNVDSSPFTDNFPRVPVAGVFCIGEIGRCTMQNHSEESEGRCCSHIYSTVYLVMEYS